MQKRHISLAAAAVLAALAAAGCGSQESSLTTTQADETVAWADGVCTAITDYKDAIRRAHATFDDGNLTVSSLQAASQEMEAATKTLTQTLKGLGTPQTEAGAAAKQTVDKLASSIQGHVTAVQAAVTSSPPVEAVAVAANALANVKSSVSSAVAKLEEQSASGEIQDAFAQAPACKSVTSG